MSTDPLICPECYEPVYLREQDISQEQEGKKIFIELLVTCDSCGKSWFYSHIIDSMKEFENTW